MPKIRTRLVLIAAMLAVSLALLVTASMAWFTLSTAPEINGIQVSLFADQALLVRRDEEGALYDQSINISDLFEGLAPLKPISTADGVNWFLPSYTEDGALDTENFVLADVDVNGNVSIQGLTGAKLHEAESNGYFVYADFYLTTELAEGCDVTLSVPDMNSAFALDQWEKDKGVYGTYAMATYGLKENGSLAALDNDVQSALRVGFLVGEGSDQRFVIYEPNADIRSSDTYKPYFAAETGSDEALYIYVDGFKLKLNPDYEVDENGQVISSGQPKFLNYIDHSYIPTKPIGYWDSGDIGPVDIAPEDLIIQLAGQWNQAAVQKALAAGELPNSNCVDIFGKFVSENSQVLDNLNDDDIFVFGQGQADMDLASQSIIVHLDGPDADGNLQETKIRMFIWLEGQDADCWNDIASGSFLLNLEFAAQS